jgi:hypothetical protein
MFTNHFSSLVFHRFAFTIIAIFALMGAPLAQAQSSTNLATNSATNTVGKVAVSVGEAKRVASSGKTDLLQVGLTLSTGDKIVTGQDAVAILVFSDEGRISVRPDSELIIRHYEVDPKGVNTRIELELTKGTIRQISGNGSRSQPEKYRLNTPIAVIGVRGTDFLAKTSQGATEAFVHEGKIVVVANAPGCDLSAQTGCASFAMASAASGMSYVKLNQNGQVEQRAVMSGELEKLFGIELVQGAKNAVPASRANEVAEFRLPQGTKFVTETIFAASNYKPEEASTSNPASTLPATSADLSALAVVTPTAPTAPSQTVTQPVTSPVTPTIIQPVTPPPPAPLVWGRFASATALPTQFIVAYEQASQGRHVTVGELGEYALWRTNPAGRLDPSLKGEASFTLNNAEAMLVQATGTSAAQVNGASLSVNFDRSTFAAGVSLSHQATGAVSLNVSGKVNEEGVFVGTNATERVAGALSLDGSKAGYLFSKDVSAGTLKGVTLWTRK